MVIKIYSRVFTNDTDASLTFFEPLLGIKPDYRFKMGELEITGLGDICLVAGTNEVLDPIRQTRGPFIVDDLEKTKSLLLKGGAVITKAESDAPTGRLFYARHPDGTEVEYLQWHDDLVKRLIQDRKR